MTDNMAVGDAVDVTFLRWVSVAGAIHNRDRGGFRSSEQRKIK